MMIEVEGVELAGAPVDRLDAGDDDRVLGVAALEARRVDAGLHPHLRRDQVELLERLLEQFLHVRQDENAPVPPPHGVPADRGHDGRLAPPVGITTHGLSSRSRRWR